MVGVIGSIPARDTWLAGVAGASGAQSTGPVHGVAGEIAAGDQPPRTLIELLSFLSGRLSEPQLHEAASAVGGMMVPGEFAGRSVLHALRAMTPPLSPTLQRVAAILTDHQLRWFGPSCAAAGTPPSIEARHRGSSGASMATTSLACVSPGAIDAVANIGAGDSNSASSGSWPDDPTVSLSDVSHWRRDPSAASVTLPSTLAAWPPAEPPLGPPAVPPPADPRSAADPFSPPPTQDESSKLALALEDVAGASGGLVDLSHLTDLPPVKVTWLISPLYYVATPAGLHRTLASLEDGYRAGGVTGTTVDLLCTRAMAGGASELARRARAFEASPADGGMAGLWKVLAETKAVLLASGIINADEHVVREAVRTP